MTVVDTLTLNVEERAHNYAKIYAALLNDEFQRKRAYASIVALYALVNALEKTDISIQKSMTLFRNPKLNEEYEISDLYVNNYHIDVRVIVEGDAVLLPKTHFENNILPDYYAVVKVDKTLRSAVLKGFLKTKGIKTEPFDCHYFSASLDNLISYDEFLLNVNIPKSLNFTNADHELFQTSYLALMDDELDANSKNMLIRHLFSCPECRAEFCCFTGFEMVSCNSSKYPELINDKTLDIIGGNAIDDEKYEGKEETVYIGNEENPDEIAEEREEKEEENSKEEEIPEDDEEKEETVSDILDELFNIDEITEETHPEDKTVEITPVQNDETVEEIKEEQIPEETNSAPEEITEIEPENIEEEYPTPMFKDEDGELTAENENIEDLNYPETEADKLYENDTENSIEYVEENDADMQIIPEEENKTEEEIKSDADSYLVLYHENDDNSQNETSANTVSAQDKTEVQKVIVDYDEYGEPIYSYITNIPNAEENPSEIVDDENVLDEEFEVYAPEEDSELSHIKNGGSRPVEYVETDNISDTISDVVLDDSTSEISNISEVEDVSLLADDNDNWEEEAQKAAEAEDEEETEDTDDSSSVNDDETENALLNENASDVDEENSSEIQNEYENTDSDEEYEEDDSNQDENSDYEEEEEFEEYDEESDEYYDETAQNGSQSKKTTLIAIIVILSVLIASGFGIFALFKNNNSQTGSEINNNYGENNSENNFFEEGQNQQVERTEENNDMFGEPQEVQGEIIPANEENPENSEELPPPPENNESENSEEVNHVPPLTENDLIVPKNNEPISDVNKAITNAFSNNGNTVSVRNVNWLCTPQLFTDPAFKNYLQNIDNVLKLNLRKNVLDANETAQNDTVSVKMAVDNSGNLLKYVIADSSGSGQIDEIVLRSIKETFEGEKAQILNDSALKADKYYLKVVIKI